MIKFIGWATVIGLGLYTGVLQMVLALIGMGFIWVAAFIASIVGVPA